MTRTIFTNISIFDGSGEGCFPGEVAIEGNLIAAVSRGSHQLDRAGTVVDGRGATLMPGMVEGHAHMTYPYAEGRFPQDGRDIMSYLTHQVGVEEHTLMSAHNARVLLDTGFTSAYSAGGATATMEVALREEIRGGWLAGPRFKAAGTEGVLPPPGANPMDPPAWIDPLERGSSVESVRAYVRESAEKGADVVKFVLSGPGFYGPEDMGPMYTDEELLAAGEQARESGVWLSGHARPAVASKQALRAGFRVLYHCDFIDDEVLDLMESRRDDFFFGPSIGVLAALNAFAPTPELARQTGFALAAYRANVEKIRQRGVRVTIGGDYGFREIPHGHNAREIDYFVRHLGFAPIDALLAATRWGGEQMGEKVGRIAEGWYADILLVDGDPSRDVSILSDRDKLLMIVADGRIHKAPLPARL